MSEEGHKFKSTDIYQTKAGVGAQYFSDNQPSKKPHKIHQFNLKLFCRILTILLIILVLGVTAFTIYSLVNKPANQTSNIDSATEVTTITNNKDDIITSAHSTNDYQAFLQVYNNQISQAQTAAAQAYLYSLRASDILNHYYNADPQATYKDQAIADVLKAYELDPTSNTASDVAICYTWVNEPDLAAQYYALAEQENSNETE